MATKNKPPAEVDPHYFRNSDLQPADAKLGAVIPDAPAAPLAVVEQPPTNEFSLGAIMQRAKDWDLDKLERIIAMREREDAKIAKAAFNRDLSRLQTSVKSIFKDGYNAETRKSYPTLNAVNDAVRPMLEQCGFSIVGGEDVKGSTPTHLLIFVEFRHVDGHTERSSGFFPPDTTGPKGGATKSEVQGRGSSITYGVKYLKAAYLGLSFQEQKDSDGQKNDVATDEQVASVQSLLDELTELRKGTDKPFDYAKFLKWLNLESLCDLPAKRVVGVTNEINRLIKAAKGSAS